jgi:hypothetical protein
MIRKYGLQMGLLSGFFIVVLVSGCNINSEGTPTPQVDEVVVSSSPVATVVATVNSPVSPPPPPTATPEPGPVLERFILDEPVKVGDTAVSGVGTPNVPIKIYEVAKTADFLGEVVVAEDGTFSITFDRPLRPTERVGVTVGDLTGTPFNYQDFKAIAIRDVPTYGYILADVHVQE